MWEVLVFWSGLVGSGRVWSGLVRFGRVWSVGGGGFPVPEIKKKFKLVGKRHFKKIARGGLRKMENRGHIRHNLLGICHVQTRQRYSVLAQQIDPSEKRVGLETM